MPEPIDETLLRGVADSDEHAFRTLYRRHTPAMYAAAFRLLARRRADAEDAVQEAWLRALRGLAGFRRESTFRTWVVGISIRCALEIGRRHHHTPSSEGLAEPFVAAAAPSVDLEHAVAALADGYRHVLLLHDLEGYTHAEIAELLGINEGTSKSQLSRARALVRRFLTQPNREGTYGS